MVNKKGVISCNRVIFKYAFSKSCDSHYLEFLMRSKTLVLLTIKYNTEFFLKRDNKVLGLEQPIEKNFQIKTSRLYRWWTQIEKELAQSMCWAYYKTTDRPQTTDNQSPTHQQVLQQIYWLPTTDRRPTDKCSTNPPTTDNQPPTHEQGSYCLTDYRPSTHQQVLQQPTEHWPSTHQQVLYWSTNHQITNPPTTTLPADRPYYNWRQPFDLPNLF